MRAKLLVRIFSLSWILLVGISIVLNGVFYIVCALQRANYSAATLR